MPKDQKKKRVIILVFTRRQHWVYYIPMVQSVELKCPQEP